MTTLTDPSHTSTHVRCQLDDSIHRVRRRLLSRGVLRWTGFVVGMLALSIGLDYLIHFAWYTRAVLLAGVLAAGYWMMIRWVLSARRVLPAQSDMALNLSHPSPSLAALVDLHPSPASDPIEHALTEAIHRRTTPRFDSNAGRVTLDSKPLIEMLGIALGLAMLLAVSISQPAAISIGAQRVLIPWTQAQWPKRFGITLPESPTHHPSDMALIAGAMIGPSDADPGAKLRWRLINPNASSNPIIVGWTTLSINPQGTPKPNQTSRRYEQLIPIHTLSSDAIPSGAVLEYKVSTHDDSSNAQRITIVHPPKLRRVIADITLPEYAGLISNASISLARGTHEITPSSLSVGPVLEGSSIRLAWEFDTPVQDDQSGDPFSTTITTEHTLDASSTLSILPIDRFGFSSRSAMEAFVRVVPDSPPDATITEPSTDLVVGQNAIIKLDARLTDDLGLDQGSIYAAPLDAPEDQYAELIGSDFQGQLEHTLATSIDLTTRNVQPGHQLMIRAHATDIRGLESRSPARIIRVVEDSEIVDQVESRLGSISEILRRLDDRQSELITRTREGSPPSPQDQAQLTEQIEARLRSTESLIEDLEQSRIDDPQLSPMLEQLTGALIAAQDSSEHAAERLQREQNDDAIEPMESVRDELGSAIAMLDRGQDTWLAQRAIEDLRDQVQSIMTETQQLGNQTGGKSIGQLSENEQSMLQRILDKQRRVTQDARETIDALDQQADSLDENNPTGAQGIRDAASQGRNSGIEEQLAQAGDEIAQNQTSSAAATQQQVLEELDKMLEQIEQAQKNRDSALRRKLASIMESIEAIIEDQQDQLARLDNNEKNLDPALITIRTNTLGVRDDAEAAFPETRSIAESLTSATEAQATAISSLRADPIDLITARQSELAALTHLQAALDEAKRQDEQAANRQAQKLRDELREKYQQALDTQSEITVQTEPMVGQALNRRQRAQSRRLASEEESLRTQLAQMLSETEELSEATIFSLAHSQLDELFANTAEGLAGRSIDPVVIQDQHSIAILLTALVEVLSDSTNQDTPNEFEDGQGGSGEGQGGGGDEPVIPPIAQIQLLRSLQQLTATQTRALNESDAPDPARIRQNGDMQRELAEKGAQLIQEMNPEPPSHELPIAEPDSPVEPDPTEETDQ